MKVFQNKFIKKISIYFIGTFSTNMLSVLLVPIYAYFVAANDLGNYDYVSAIANIVTPIVFIVIWEALLKYCIRESRDKIDSFISTAICFCLLFSSVCGLIFFLVWIFTNNDYLFLIFLFVVIHGFVSIWQYTSRALGENKRYVQAGISGSITLIVADLMCVAFAELNYMALCITHLLSQIVIILVLEQKVRILSRVKIRKVSKKSFLTLAAFSVPLVINNVSMWAYSSGTKVIIQNSIGSMENGLYSFASKFSMLISLFSTVISMAIIEEAYSYETIEEYRVKVSKLITTISKGYFSLVTLALPAIYILYSIAFRNTEYYNSCDYIFILLISSLFTALSNNYGSSFQVTNTTKYISITTIIGAGIALLCGVILAKPLGVYGVLIAGMVGPFTMMVLRAIYAKKATGMSISWRNNIIIFAFCFVVYVILSRYKTIWIQIVLLFIACVFIVLEYRNEIKSLKNSYTWKRNDKEM